MNRTGFLLSVVTVTLGLGLSACGDSGGTSSGTGGGATGSGGGGGASGSGGGALLCDATVVPCQDQVLLEMNLQTDLAPGLATNEADGTGWRSTVDATAGGAFTNDPDSYVYARFTSTGLEKVEISDEDALASMDWDIAFRRYVIRINSGHSGPSCVQAARLPGTPVYDDLTVAPDNLTFRADEYFTESCEIIADGTGLPGSPATALSSFWTYPGCVAMTGNVFVVKLATGADLKLTVTNFYDDASQQQCQDMGTVPMTGNGSANIQLRWAFL